MINKKVWESINPLLDDTYRVSIVQNHTHSFIHLRTEYRYQLTPLTYLDREAHQGQTRTVTSIRLAADPRLYRERELGKKEKKNKRTRTGKKRESRRRMNRGERM